MKISHAFIIGVITVCLSVAGSVGVVGAKYGTLTERVNTIKEEQKAIRGDIKILPSIQTDLVWVKEQLKSIADHLGAPKAKE